MVPLRPVDQPASCKLEGLNTAMSSQSDRDRRKSRRSARKVAAEKQAKRRRQFTMAGAVGVALLIALGLIVVPRLGGSGSGPGSIRVASAHPASIPSDGKLLGDPNAPVKLVEYGNYQ
jgi:hypothetical protein